MTSSTSVVGCARPGAERALDLFQRAAVLVPAYREFLADNGIRADAVRTVEDFTAVPAITAANYLRRYPLPDQLWSGEITRAGTWSTSSGSTGAPSYWPRDGESYEDSIISYDRIFRDAFGTHRRSTLVVVGFALGNWIGGTYTYRAALALRERGHRLSVIAPGIEADTILANIAALGPHYEQVVLCGYPPFVKDVLDRADREVLNQDLRVLLAGENITEEWRDHVLDRIGAPGESERICLIYGTADAGVMGYETPTTVALRRLARADRRLREDLFGDDPVLPTFVEYDPLLRYTEVDADGRFLFTVDSTLPLIRYRINDEGRLLTGRQITEALLRSGHRLPEGSRVTGAEFLALGRRTDIAASFYAVKLYPDSIRAALEHPAFRDSVSGKFVMTADTGAGFGQTLHLLVELRENLSVADISTDTLREHVTAGLRRTNDEYRRLHSAIGAAAEPVVTVAEFGDDRFRYAVKHSYLERAR